MDSCFFGFSFLFGKEVMRFFLQFAVARFSLILKTLNSGRVGFEESWEILARRGGGAWSEGAFDMWGCTAVDKY